MATEARRLVQCGACRQWVDLVPDGPQMVSHELPGEPPRRCWSGGTTRWEWPIRREPPEQDPNDTYCVCPDCIRCGCGIWERHHTNLGDITPVTTPKETR